VSRKIQVSLSATEIAAMPAAILFFNGTWRGPRRPPKYATFKERVLGHHLFSGASDRFMRAAYSRYVRGRWQILKIAVPELPSRSRSSG
jgi:hypothetical protein